MVKRIRHWTAEAGQVVQGTCATSEGNASAVEGRQRATEDLEARPYHRNTSREGRDRTCDHGVHRQRSLQAADDAGCGSTHRRQHSSSGVPGVVRPLPHRGEDVTRKIT
uniref:(northern house mosquito) hypothetical protein n=1 Tax=Culex pipiens TaxID=7175 RepID=A0A8D8AAH5_CULPI